MVGLEVVDNYFNIITIYLLYKKQHSPLYKYNVPIYMVHKSTKISLYIYNLQIILYNNE